MQSEQFPWKLSLVTSLGAYLGDVLFYPFDTLATRQKACQSRTSLNFVQMLHWIHNNESLGSLYRGINTSFMSIFVPFFIYFGIYEQLNIMFHRSIDRHSSPDKAKHHNIIADNRQLIKCGIPLITSSIAEFFSLLAYLPIDIIRTRLQVNDLNYQYRSIYSGLKDIANNEGFLRIYKASHLYMINYISLTAIQFWIFENLRSAILQDNGTSLDLFQSIPLSLFSTSVATIATCPIDIVFTRQQLLDTSCVDLNGRQIFMQIVRKEGWMALFKGGAIKTLQTSLFSLFYLPLYDKCKTVYGAQQQLH